MSTASVVAAAATAATAAAAPRRVSDTVRRGDALDISMSPTISQGRCSSSRGAARRTMTYAKREQCISQNLNKQRKKY